MEEKIKVTLPLSLGDIVEMYCLIQENGSEQLQAILSNMDLAAVAQFGRSLDNDFICDGLGEEVAL